MYFNRFSFQKERPETHLNKSAPEDKTMDDWDNVCALPVPAVSAQPPAARSHVSAALRLLQETPVLLSWQFSAWLTGPFLTFCGPQSAPPNISAASEAAAGFPWASPHTEPSVCHLKGGKVGIINHWFKECIFCD